MIRYSFLLLVVCLASCTKYTPVPTAGTTKPGVLQYIASDTSLHLYNLAMERSGLDTDGTFTTGGPFTLFAPQDSAFLQYGLDSAALVRMDTGTLRHILQYGIVNGRISSQDLTGFYTEPVICQNPWFEPTVTKNYYGIFINGDPAVRANIELGDGVVQELGRVFIPPTGTLLGEIDSLPELSFLASALHRNARLRKVLDTIYFNDYSGTPVTGMTMLAPVNNAFQVFGFPDTASMQAADSAYMDQLITNYIYQGSHYTSEFMGGYQFGGGAAGQLTGTFVLLVDGMTFQSYANVLHTVHIIKPNITATNGILDELDYVLIPGK